MFSFGFFVINDTIGGSQDQNTKLTRGKKTVGPLFKISDLDVEARGDDGALVDAAQKGDHNLSSSVIINDFEFSNVAVLLHDTQELHNDLGGRADQALALTTSFSVGNGTEAVSEGIDENHIDSRILITSSEKGDIVRVSVVKKSPSGRWPERHTTPKLPATFFGRKLLIGQFYFFIAASPLSPIVTHGLESKVYKGFL